MSPRTTRRSRGARAWTALRLVVGAVYVFLLLPIVAVALLSFSENISVIDFRHFTLRWYRHLFTDEPILAALRFSIELGVLASALAVTLGSLAAFGAQSLPRHEISRARLRSFDFNGS